MRLAGARARALTPKIARCASGPTNRRWGLARKAPRRTHWPTASDQPSSTPAHKRPCWRALPPTPAFEEQCELIILVRADSGGELTMDEVVQRAAKCGCLKMGRIEFHSRHTKQRPHADKNIAISAAVGVARPLASHRKGSLASDPGARPRGRPHDRDHGQEAGFNKKTGLVRRRCWTSLWAHPPSHFRALPHLTQNINSGVSHVASGADTQQTPCQEWPVKWPISTPGTDSGEHWCYLQSAAWS